MEGKACLRSYSGAARGRASRAAGLFPPNRQSDSFKHQFKTKNSFRNSGVWYKKKLGVFRLDKATVGGVFGAFESLCTKYRSKINSQAGNLLKSPKKINKKAWKPPNSSRETERRQVSYRTNVSSATQIKRVEVAPLNSFSCANLQTALRAIIWGFSAGGGTVRRTERLWSGMKETPDGQQNSLWQKFLASRGTIPLLPPNGWHVFTLGSCLRRWQEGGRYFQKIKK